MQPRVLIAQPLYSHVPPAAHASWTSFILSASMIGKGSFVFQAVNMYIDQVRNDAVKYALGEGKQKLTDITHVLYVDSDMVLPGDGLERLLKLNKPISSGLYFGKVPPFPPVAFMFGKDGGIERLPDYDDDTVMEVDGAGMGFCLISVDVFRQMRETYKDENWFRCGEGIGEDVWFFMRAKEMGLPCWLDTSIECGHVGELTVNARTFRTTAEQVARKEKAA